MPWTTASREQARGYNGQEMAGLVISNWNQIMDFLKQIAMLQTVTT
jgi:hypothetical protein